MYITMVIRDSLPDNPVIVGNDRDEEILHFLNTCKMEISNWDEYTPEDIEVVLDEGYVQTGNGKSVVFMNLTNFDPFWNRK